ncbi:MAG: hypothetical protein JWM19_967 [Actinomycetia bacterium]|nr:hypothetical protein [Actinomycetes bacterium]
MDDELKVTVTVRGVRNPHVAVTRIMNLLKRSLYLIDGEEGSFTARIDAPGVSIELDENREWQVAEGQRVRDSNSRGGDPNRVSTAAP